MILHITEFFSTLLGVALPETVFVILGFTLAYFLLRSFLTIFNVKPKILDFAFYVIVVYLAVYDLGGVTWQISF